MLNEFDVCVVMVMGVFVFDDVVSVKFVWFYCGFLSEMVCVVWFFDCKDCISVYGDDVMYIVWVFYKVCCECVGVWV